MTFLHYNRRFGVEEGWQIKAFLVLKGSDLHSAVEAENGGSWLPGAGV